MCFWRAKRIPLEYSHEGDRFVISWNGYELFSCPFEFFAFELEAINKYSFTVNSNYGDTPVKFKYRVTTNGILIDEYQELIEGEWIHSSSKLRKRFNSQQKHTL